MGTAYDFGPYGNNPYQQVYPYASTAQAGAGASPPGTDTDDDLAQRVSYVTYLIKQQLMEAVWTPAMGLDYITRLG